MAGHAATIVEHVIPYTPRRWARPFHASFARFYALVLHRRAGKTTAIVNHHQRAVMDDEWERRRLCFLKPDLTDANLLELIRSRGYAHIMPSYKQAEVVAWRMLKHYADPILGRKFNEQKLRVTYPGGHTFQLFGADDPDSLRGLSLSGVSFDEYSQQPQHIFGEVISKALADHLGYAIFAGTIKGTDHLFKTYEAGKNSPLWFALWQTVDVSLATEDQITVDLLEHAMADDRDLISKGLTTQSEYDQEWFLSADAAIRGAFYGKELDNARQANRITRVPYDPLLPVDTDWDLGMDDTTAIWFSQSLRSGEIRLIDFYEASGEGLPHYAKALADKPYVYGQHWAPHDIKVRELGTGKTRLKTAESLGIKFHIVPNLDLADGINAVRLILSRCWFDEDKCRVGLHALRNYRKTYNKSMNEFTGTPVHNWASHPSDAFRGLSVRHKRPEDDKKDPPADPFERFTRGPVGTPHSWMGM